MAIALRDIDLNENALRDFHYLAVNIDKLPIIRETGKKIGPQPGLARLTELIESEAKLPFGEARDIVRHLLQMRHSAEMFNVTPAEFIGLITEAFKAKASQEQDKVAFNVWDAKKKEICEAVESFLSDDVFLLSEKAGRITYAHQNIFKDAQILTDLRPVFNESATGIIQAIVTHALYLEYYDGTETRRLELTLDATDVATLKRLCSRAEQKAITARDSLKETLKVIVFNEWDERKHD